MKKTLSLIISLIIISIFLFVEFTKAEDSKLTEEEALIIGEEKYLEFLWMVDGAFNSEKMNGDFVVNGKILNNDSKKFTCIYKNKNSNSCIGNNFEEEFKRIFSSNISYDMVYGEGTYTWIKYEKGKYIFTNLDTCVNSRMNLDQSIELENMKNNELTFYVTRIGEGYNKTKTKMFVLTKENGDWKVSRAYYHDICELDYNIG